MFYDVVREYRGLRAEFIKNKIFIRRPEEIGRFICVSDYELFFIDVEKRHSIGTYHIGDL